jgi:WD40 repeat protein
MGHHHLSSFADVCALRRKVHQSQDGLRLVRALCDLGDGKLFSGSVESGKIRVWSSNGAHLHTLTGHEAGVYALALKPDGTLFSGGSHVLHDYHGDDDHEVGDVAMW